VRTPLSWRRDKRRGLQLWPVGRVLVLAFAAAVLVAASAFYTGWDLLGAHGLKPEHRLDSSTLFDLVKLSFGIVAGAGALVALVVAYRRQRVDEDGALRDATRLHTERFTTAVAQLGDNSAAVRLGGVHALAGLADDAPTRDLRQTCIDVLCAFLRLPYTAESDVSAFEADARHAYLALREVRHTVIRLIRNHLRLPPEHAHSWQGHDFDLTSVTFDGGDFSEAQFSGGTVDFRGARFSDGTVSFMGAQFSGAEVLFVKAEFSGSTVNFMGAKFSGSTVIFAEAQCSGGTVDFRGAEFSGGTVDLSWAEFSGAAVDFGRAEFSGSAVCFNETEFSGSAVQFEGAQFSGGTVEFLKASFSDGTVSFGEALFTGGLFRLGGATQSSDGRIAFIGSESSGRVSFTQARFSGCTVNFTQALGSPPIGLVPLDGAPFPLGLILSPAWYPTGA
jgi:uncharacterized protein YjbI with pentapeptide repeats